MEHIGGNLKKLVKPSIEGMSLASRLGKIPPQAIELEEAVLGALMLEREAYESVKDIIKAESFYKDEHKLIFSAIHSLWKKKHPIDILTVTNELRSEGKLEFVGGAYYISELTNRIGSAANVQYHSYIIQQKFILRQLIEIGNTAIEGAFDQTIDVFDLLDSTTARLQAISDIKFARKEQRFSEALIELREIDSVAEDSTETHGIATGFLDHDKKCGKFAPGELIIIAARTSMGKTSWALDIAYNVATKQKKPVAFFSMEMPNRQLTARILSHDLRVPVTEILNRKISKEIWNEVDLKIKKFEGMDLYLDDTPELNVLNLHSKIRKLVSKYEVEEVFIDYLQLMDGHPDRRKDNREQEISVISRHLKKYAKEFGIPIIALSQLSRRVDERKDRRPILSDLRESGSQEQDADRVLFLYRPESYGISSTKAEGVQVSTHGLTELIVAKNRNGAVGTTLLYFDAPYTHFSDWVWGYSDRLQDHQAKKNMDDAGERFRDKLDKENSEELPF